MQDNAEAIEWFHTAWIWFRWHLWLNVDYFPRNLLQKNHQSKLKLGAKPVDNCPVEWMRGLWYGGEMGKAHFQADWMSAEHNKRISHGNSLQLYWLLRPAKDSCYNIQSTAYGEI